MKIRTFDIEKQKITTLLDGDKKVWFVAYEVCSKLEFANTSDAIKNHCNPKGIANGYTLTDGGKQKTLLIDEPNLYRLISRSKKESAVKFQDWIFEVVLPSIRETGEYNISQCLKNQSSEIRNGMTDAWKECGVSKPHEFMQLTFQEYKSLGFQKEKRKKDMTKEELLTLAALESMETLKLFHEKKDGYYECRDSLQETAKVIPFLKPKEIVN